MTDRNSPLVAARIGLMAFLATWTGQVAAGESADLVHQMPPISSERVQDIVFQLPPLRPAAPFGSLKDAPDAKPAAGPSRRDEAPPDDKAREAATVPPAVGPFEPFQLRRDASETSAASPAPMQLVAPEAGARAMASPLVPGEDADLPARSGQGAFPQVMAYLAGEAGEQGLGDDAGDMTVAREIGAFLSPGGPLWKTTPADQRRAARIVGNVAVAALAAKRKSTDKASPFAIDVGEMLPTPRPVNSEEYSITVIGVSLAAALLFCYAALEFFVGYGSQQGGSTLVAEIAKRFRTAADARLAAVRGVSSTAQRPKIAREGAAPKPAARSAGLFRGLPALAAALARATGRKAEEPLPPTPVDLTRIARPARAAANIARTEPAGVSFNSFPGAEAVVASSQGEDPVADPAPAASATVEPIRSREPARDAEIDDLVLVEPGDAEAVSAARTRLVAAG